MGVIYLNGVKYAGGGSGGGGGTSDYEELINKPSLNGVPLTNGQTSEDLNIQVTVQEAANSPEGFKVYEIYQGDPTIAANLKGSISVPITTYDNNTNSLIITEP